MYLQNKEPHFQENAVPSLPRKLQVRTDREESPFEMKGKTLIYEFLIIFSNKGDQNETCTGNWTCLRSKVV